MSGDGFKFDFNDAGLAGRVVLVAGGTGGLGAATVALLARDGATVVAGYRSNHSRAEALEQAVRASFDREIRLVEGDISDPDVRARYVEVADSIGEGLVVLNGEGHFFEYRMTIRTRDAKNANALARTLNDLPVVVEFRISPTGD